MHNSCGLCEGVVGYSGSGLYLSPPGDPCHPPNMMMRQLSRQAPCAKHAVKPMGMPAVNVRRPSVHGSTRQTRLVCSAVPVAELARASAAEGIRAALAPTADYFSSLGVPDWLVHWGHPGNMAVVLFAMGGYGAAYLGWQIRVSDDGELVAKAKELHPKLSLGMFIFFALGATGGMMSLIMQGKPIFGSAHVWTGLTGLTLLSFQAMLPLFFADSRDARSVHAYLGTGIMGLFLVHAALGLQLGLSI